ncbi:hypothetical protein B0A54_12275 [Friedmanniomyces endolithicus]|uniref:Vacuolar membrane-associated protein IML1 n=1 Tax=Friedmanniomyces endolithicus TaxID=329885 RepID=A0A4U0UJG8_9PEZI|nr:hypothetical protein B0A54_12275 [Friedmanniomyces endolithicus]
MAIDQLRRSCSVVLHDDRVSTEDALCGSDVLPLGILAKLSASDSTPIYILAASAAAQRDEISIHVSLALRFGFQNRANATVKILETADTVAATATHIEFFFRDQHLSRADMWRIMQRLDATVAYKGQKVSYLGSLAAEVRAIYVAGKEVSSAYVTHAKTKPIFRSGNARYTIMIQISKEMLEHWIDSELMYERVISGFLPELFQKWDALKSRHQVTVVLFGRCLKKAEDVQADDFFHVVDSDVSSSDWRRLLRRLKRTFNGPSLPSQVSLAARGNILQAIHMAAMDFANDNVDPHLRSRGTSIIAITAGAGLFETDHDLLKSTTHLLMGNSIGVDIVAMSPKPFCPVPLFSYQRDLASMIEDRMPNVVLEAEAVDVSESPTAKDDLFYIAMKAAEAEGHWKTSPWLTLLNPCNPTRDNMRVAAQYRKWQHVFPRAVSPMEFKWASMCSPAALPLTTEYAPSVRELQKQFTKEVRRLLVSRSEDRDRLGSSHALSQLIKLRLTYGFQLAATERMQPRSGQSDCHERVLMSLGNAYHDLYRLSDTELQVVEYRLDEANEAEARKEVNADDKYHIRVRSAGSTKAASADVRLMTPRSEPAWASLDEEVVAHGSSHAEVDAARMRLVLIPIEPPRPGHITPGPSRGLSDEERHIDGIQKLTQLWQRNRYITPGDRRHQASLSRPKTTPRMAPRDPNPLAIEYQTRDPSAVAFAYGSAATAQHDGQEQATPIFAESEMYHSTGFDVTKLVKQMQELPPYGVEVRDRRWFARMHFKCFRGDEMVNWLLRVFRDLQTREDAIAIGKDLMERGVFSHVRARHEFRDGNYFYQIASTHRTTVYPDNASVFGRSSLKSVPSTPVAEPRSSPFVRPLRGDGTSSGKPTLNMAPLEKKQLLLSEKILYNADPGQKSDQLEIISLHYDRIHNPENCYHILLEWVNTTAILVREAVNRWTTLAEAHGLKLVQVPCVEASKLHMHHPLEVPISVKLALRPPETTPMTPAVDGQASGTQRVTADSHAYQKALLRKLDFVLDFEAAANFPAKVEVLYSYGKPDYDMTQYIHKSGLLLAQICGDGSCDFLLVLNRLAAARTSIAGRPPVEVEVVEHIVKRFVKVCQDEKALKTFYEQTKQPPPSPSMGNEYGMDNDVPPIQLPPRLAHRAVMRTVL